MSVRCISKVLEESGHAGTELLMLVVLADYSDDDGNSYPAVASLARKCRMSSRNANYILSALQASGELRVLKNEGPKGTNRYRIMLSALGRDRPLKPASPLTRMSPLKPTSSPASEAGFTPERNCTLKPTSSTPEAGFPKPLKPTSDEPSLNRQEPSYTSKLPLCQHDQSVSQTSPSPGRVRQPDPTSPPPGPPPVRLPDGSSPPAGPDTSIHQEDTRDMGTSGKPAVPECPHRDLLDLFGKHLPELAQPRPELWSGKNAEAMRARWRWVLTARKGSGERYAESRQEAVDFFARFFEHVAESDFLCGRAGEWSCNLGWLMKAENFAKVVQGNYDNKTAAASARKEHA